MGYTKEQRVINRINGHTKKDMTAPPKYNNVSPNLVIPNKSGDHFKSYKRDVPTTAIDLVNK